MRLLLACFFIIPITCYAGVLEDCSFQGNANGKNITLNWIYDYNSKLEGFGVKNSRTYGFCMMEVRFTELMENHIYGMKCAATIGGEQTVHYKSDDNGTTFICQQGCSKEVAGTLIMVCK